MQVKLLVHNKSFKMVLQIHNLQFPQYYVHLSDSQTLQLCLCCSSSLISHNPCNKNASKHYVNHTDLFLKCTAVLSQSPLIQNHSPYLGRYWCQDMHGPSIFRSLKGLLHTLQVCNPSFNTLYVTLANPATMLQPLNKLLSFCAFSADVSVVQDEIVYPMRASNTPSICCTTCCCC